MRKYNKEYSKKYMKGNQVIRLFHSAKKRAKELGLEFTLEHQDVVIPELCPYLLVPLTNIYGGKQKENAPYNASLDRIDAKQGYIKGNVQVISNLANRMKNNATEDQLLIFAINVLKIHGKEFVNGAQ